MNTCKTCGQPAHVLDQGYTYCVPCALTPAKLALVALSTYVAIQLMQPEPEHVAETIGRWSTWVEREPDLEVKP